MTEDQSGKAARSDTTQSISGSASQKPKATSPDAASTSAGSHRSDAGATPHRKPDASSSGEASPRPEQTKSTPRGSCAGSKYVESSSLSSSTAESGPASPPDGPRDAGKRPSASSDPEKDAKIGLLELTIITPEMMRDGVRREESVFLFHTNGSPLMLGSGRYAYVALAASGVDPKNADLLAVKFLKKDESPTISKNARIRFFEELKKTEHFSSHRATRTTTFVKYRGFSRLELSAELDDLRAVGEKTFLGHVKEQLDKLVKENTERVEKDLNLDFKRSIQGDFFVMNAEQGTLDDLLIYNRPWTERPYYKLSSIDKKRLSEFIEEQAPEAQEVIESIRKESDARFDNGPKHPDDASGLAIMKYIGAYSQTKKNNISISLFKLLVDALKDVHRGGGSDDDTDTDHQNTYMAHRDLKPGNFLVSWNVNRKNFEVRLSDLGFVGDPEAHHSLVASMGMNSLEPLTLCPGSYLFRAPEQVSPAFEIRFEMSSPDGGTQIEFVDIGGITVEPGDRIRSQEVWFGTQKKDNICVVKKVILRGRRIVAELNEPIFSRTKQADSDSAAYHIGYLIRPSSQHTDIFSLGSIFYFLVTGGKNAEDFYTKCIEPSPYHKRGGEADQDRQDAFLHDVYGTCFGLALSLCKDAPERVMRDLICFKPSSTGLDEGTWNVLQKKILQTEPIETKSEPAREALSRPGPAPQPQSSSGPHRVKDLIQRIRPPAWSTDPSKPQPDEEDADKLRQRKEEAQERRQARQKGEDLSTYVKHLRSNPSIEYYLRDSNDQPLPFPIVYEIIRCMLRGSKDSYIIRSKGNDESYGYYGRTDAAERLSKDLDRILSSAPSCKDDFSRWTSLGETPAAQFFALRLCYKPPS